MKFPVRPWHRLKRANPFAPRWQLTYQNAYEHPGMSPVVIGYLVTKYGATKAQLRWIGALGPRPQIRIRKVYTG